MNVWDKKERRLSNGMVLDSINMYWWVFFSTYRSGWLSLLCGMEEMELKALIEEYEMKVGDTTLDVIEITAIAGFLKKLYAIRKEIVEDKDEVM